MTNNFVARLNEHGFFKHFQETTQHILQMHVFDKNIVADYLAVSMSDLNIVFIIFLVGLLGSIFFVLGEIGYYKYV